MSKLAHTTGREDNTLRAASHAIMRMVEKELKDKHGIMLMAFMQLEMYYVLPSDTYELVVKTNGQQISTRVEVSRDAVLAGGMEALYHAEYIEAAQQIVAAMMLTRDLWDAPVRRMNP